MAKPGLIQENEARLGSGIFVAGNRGSAALEPGPGRRGLLENPRQTEILAVEARKVKKRSATAPLVSTMPRFSGPQVELTIRSELG